MPRKQHQPHTIDTNITPPVLSDSTASSRRRGRQGGQEGQEEAARVVGTVQALDQRADSGTFLVQLSRSYLATAD